MAGNATPAPRDGSNPALLDVARCLQIGAVSTPIVLRHAFDTLRLHRLEANIQPGNDASIALVRRAGFTREGFSRRYLKIGGRWRDHERWAILREDWLAKGGST